MAQETANNAAPGDIVVTAEFRETKLQETPLAITALNAAALEARSVTNIIQAAAAAPGLTMTPAGPAFGNSATASIRGVGQYDFNFALEPGVGMYVDDVYHATLFGSTFDLLDLDRVEVLRGPQGTLAGKNSIGGAVKLYAKKPDGEGGGYIEGVYGDFNRTDVRASADFALVPDALFLRVSGVSKQRDGYVDRIDYACANPGSGLPSLTAAPGCKLGTEGGEDVQAARVALRWLASDALELNFAIDSTNDNSESQANTLLFADNPSPFIFGGPYDSRFIPADPYQNYSTYVNPLTGVAIPVKNTAKGTGASGTVDWKINDVLSLKSITSYRRYYGEFSQDADASPLVLENIYNRVNASQFTQELRLNGESFGGQLDWTAGAFYFDGDSKISGRKDLSSVGLDFKDNDPIATTSKSAFLHGVWHATDKLNLTAGLRYTKDTKDYTYSRLNPDGTEPQPCVGPPGPANPPNCSLAGLTGLSGSYKGDRWDYRAVADYQWTPGLMTYAQFSTGYKGGGVNPRPFFPSQVLPFGPETLDAYEVGLKSEWFDKRLRMNVSAFYNNYKDIQLTLLACPLAPCALPANVGEADVKGVEIEAFAEPIPGLLIDASTSYLDFEYTNLSAPTGVTLDMITPFTPEWKTAAGVQYEIPLGSYGSLTPRLDVIYQSSMFTNAVNGPNNKVGGYTLLNGRVAWKAEGGDWETALSVTNLTDEFYYVNNFDLSGPPFGLATGQPGRPQEWAITVRRNF